MSRFSRAPAAIWLTTVVVCAAGALTLAAPARLQDASAPTTTALLHDTVAIIVSTENPTDHLSMGDLRRILLGEMTRWPNGRTITIAMRAAGQPEHDSILRLVCDMSNTDFDRHLLRTAYRGDTPSSVKVLDTAVGVRRFVVNVPGAIGFVRGDDVDASVKVMPVTGAVPAGAAFGLKLWAR